MLTVFIRGLEFYAYHGVPDEEQAIGHRYTIDLEMTVDSRSLETDEVADTVDYGKVALRLLEVATTNQYRTVERLASRLLDDLLHREPLVTVAKIKVAKRMPPAPIIAQEVGVELERRRPGI